MFQVGTLTGVVFPATDPGMDNTTAVMGIHAQPNSSRHANAKTPTLSFIVPRRMLDDSRAKTGNTAFVRNCCPKPANDNGSVARINSLLLARLASTAVAGAGRAADHAVGPECTNMQGSNPLCPNTHYCSTCQVPNSSSGDAETRQGCCRRYRYTQNGFDNPVSKR